MSIFSSNRRRDLATNESDLAHRRARFDSKLGWVTLLSVAVFIGLANAFRGMPTPAALRTTAFGNSPDFFLWVVGGMVLFFVVGGIGAVAMIRRLRP